jgi:methionine synthase II (cobalamin-independent)
MEVATATPTGLDLLRVDIVGSFLRPPALKQEERHGLPIVSDGEFRRRHFMESFADVAGKEPWRAVLNTAAATKAPESAGKPQWRKVDLLVETARRVWGG